MNCKNHMCILLSKVMYETIKYVNNTKCIFLKSLGVTNGSGAG